MRLSGLSRFFAKKFLGAGIFGKASWDEAISNMEKAVALDPGRIYHRLELAEIYADRKRYDDAEHSLTEIRQPSRPGDHGQRLPPRERATLAKRLADASSSSLLVEGVPHFVGGAVQSFLELAPPPAQLPPHARGVCSRPVQSVFRLVPESFETALELPPGFLSPVEERSSSANPRPEQGTESRYRRQIRRFRWCAPLSNSTDSSSSLSLVSPPSWHPPRSGIAPPATYRSWESRQPS